MDGVVFHFSRNDQKFRFRWIKGYKPSEHVKLGHYRPANGKLSKWRFSGGRIVAREWMLAGKPHRGRYVDSEKVSI